MRTCLRLFVLAAVFALSLSFSGPLIDHHYAERQLNHAHIYLGQFVPDHVHPYEVPHTHSHTQEANGRTSAQAPLSDKAPNDIVYLTSYDGMGQVFTQLTVPSIHLALNSPDLEGDSFAFGTPEDDTFPQDVFIVPPKKPPRI